MAEHLTDSHTQQANPNQASRLGVLDVAKGIGIILVIFAHVNYTPSLLTPIYSFHMPLFFMLSGMVYHGAKYPRIRQFLRRRWDTMLKPYLFFSLLSLAYVFISERLFAHAVDLKAREYISAFLQIFLAQGSSPVLNTPLWFVPCLFIVELIYHYLSKLKKAVCTALCCLLSCIGWLLQSGRLPFDNTLLPWTLDSAFYALSFYAAGNLLFPRIHQCIVSIQAHRNKKQICLGAFALCTLIWLPLMVINGKVSLGSRVLHNGLLFFLTGLLGTLAVLAVSILLEKNRFLLYLGQNTFCLMSVHYMIRKYTIPKYYKMLNITLYNRKVLSETIIPFLIVFVLSLLATMAYRSMIQRLSQHRKP